MTGIFGGIEAGGTKFVCAVAAGPGEIYAETRFPTGSPEKTLTQAANFFLGQMENYPLKALGVASFGPIDLDRDSPKYGYLTTTPKPGWADTDIIGPLQDALRLPVGFDTDVNGAALAEGRWGAAQGLDTFIYLTIGTGIGGGAVVNDRLLHGLSHPEMGHILVPHDRQTDPFPGVCPFHGDCLEGLANGPALAQRWGVDPQDLPEDHPAWELEARYLALALVNYIATLSPQRIILGGGVMDQRQLFPMIRRSVQALLKDYIQMPAILQTIDTFIVPPALGPQAGVLGAIALAQNELVIQS